MANDKNEKKSADKSAEKSVKKQPTTAAKTPKRSPGKYFRELRSEFKKVTWPTPKQVLNNTGVVLTMLVLSGAAIYGVDKLYNFLFSLILLRN